MRGLRRPAGPPRDDVLRLSAPRITATLSPTDPRVCAFTLDRPVASTPVLCRDAAQAAGSPLFEELFRLPGVVQALADGARVTVARNEPTDWMSFSPRVATAIRRALAGGAPPVSPGAAPAPVGDLEGAVRRLLEADINPSLAAHGGSVELVEIRDRVARLRFRGGCQGCGAAQMTLNQGVRGALLGRVPGLREVEDVTDHAAGEKPYYTEAGGASPFSPPG